MNRAPVLFLNVAVVAACGLVYELLAGTLASYVLGDSVTQFSLIIGLYLSALGVGSWLSKYLEQGLARRFIEIELAVALLGGFSAPILFLIFAHMRHFYPALYGMVFVIGVLVGLEIPILMRLLKDSFEFKDLVARVLTFDYLGALAASILFPILLVPYLGLVRTSLAFGLLNGLVGLWATFILQPQLARVAGLRVRCALVLVLLAAGFAGAGYLTTLAEDNLYNDEIVYAKNTNYQRIVVTRGGGGFQLYLNGHLQFNSIDEYRYHEALVHPAMASCASPRRIAVLGGGDGLALREILKYRQVEHVTLVDLDPGMTGLSRSFPPLTDLNVHSFDDPRVRVVNRDAMLWLEECGESFDVVVVDFPDPSNFSLGKLYTTRFYRLLKARLAPGGRVAVQSTSPLFARKSFWCINRTMEKAGFHVKPYQTAVPSFGVWGFTLASQAEFELPLTVSAEVRSLDPPSLAALFVLNADMGPVEVEINRLDNQVLVRYYDDELRRWD